MIKYILSVLVLFTSILGFSAVCTSTGDGDWDDAGTWSCGTTPSCGDTIVIDSSHTVTITSQVDISDCPEYTVMIIEGNLAFTNGNKLYMSCSSYFSVAPYGSVYKDGNGGGNSTLVEQCGTNIWTASDPDLQNYNWNGGLPIELLNFDARLSLDQVDVYWSTASEINNDYFLVQRSSNGVDFKNIDKVAGAGNSNLVLHYKTVDSDPEYGVSYYRLKQVDFNGEYSYSNIVSVEYQLEDIIIYPNPSTDDSPISIHGEGVSEFQPLLYSVDGREIPMQYSFTDYDISMRSSLPSGSYFVVLTKKGYSKTLKLIIR